MSFPIRCFTCGKPIGHLYEKYVACTTGTDSTTDQDGIHQKTLDDMKVVRMCCRRMFLTHVDIDRYLLAYPTYEGRIHRLYEKTGKVDIDLDD